MWATGEADGVVYVAHGMGAVTTIAASTMSKPHIVTFSPGATYAYVSDVGNGRVNVVRTADRAVVETLTFGAGRDTHQAKASPDGTVLLVTRRAGVNTLHKVLVNEASPSWEVSPQYLDFGALDYTPVCTVFSPDGRRAFVSVTSSLAVRADGAPRYGIAVVNVPTMTLVGGPSTFLGTDGAVACGMAEAKDGRRAYVVSNGGSGHLYLLDRAEGTLSELTYPTGIGAADLHYAALSPNEGVVYASSRGNDELKLLGLDGAEVDTVRLDPDPLQPDRPDGVAVKGDNVYVAMKDAGKLAVVKPNRGRVTYLDIAARRPNALSHVTVRS